MPTARRLRKTRPPGWLVGGGQMGALVRSMDWRKTPLGPIESWPQSLRTALSICLSSRFPMAIWWGPAITQFYNDGYWPFLGAKHPRSMGQAGDECWSEIWDVVGPLYRSVMTTGEATWSADLHLMLERSGYREETYFTFSYSPIRGEQGEILGNLITVTETTERVLGDRRQHTLRELGARTTEGKTPAEACRSAAAVLATNPDDVPFAALYLLDADAGHAHLAATAGPEAVADTMPGRIDLSHEDAGVWPVAAVARTRTTIVVDDLWSKGHLPRAAGSGPSQAVLLAPLTTADGVVGVLVAGVSPHRVLDQAYRGFFELVAGQTAIAVTNARAYEQQRQRAEALAEIDRAKTAFFSNVSHEFRTPLTLMLGPLEDELAERSSPLPSARRERLETVHRSSLRLLKLVNTLLDFSRMEAGRLQAHYEKTDLAAFTAELASGFRSTIERAGLTLTVDCPPLPEPLNVDRDMWEKIVLNLLSNAFKHTFEGDIRVTLNWCGDHAELAVADSGVGIPEAELPRLFDRFHRVKGAKSRSYEGTGIGLALVQELARAHGGTVHVDSREGRGSTFTVTVRAGLAHLPADRTGAQRSDSTATRAAVYMEEARHWVSGTPTAPALGDPPGGISTIPRPRILWADDNADMREYVRRLLIEHYDVTAVPDGTAAVAAALAAPPDLVLTDVMMPGLDGFGVLRQLRADDRTRTLPVIFLSARAGEESALEGLEAGADDYLVKPFSARELLARVRTHLEMARLRREWASELEAANKELEAFSYSVSHDLRSPLRTVDGFSQALLEDFASLLPEEGQRQIRTIRAGAQRMGVLIDDLLAFSRLGRQSLTKRVAVDMDSLVGEALEDLLPEREGRNVELRIAKLASGDGDVALLKQVWVNLLSNALKYTGKRDAAVIEVGFEADDGETVYFVRDNGTGFDMRYANKLFGVFQRLHRTEDFEGTGVGLAIVQRIIHRHGGRVWAEAAVDRGATFRFTLQKGTTS